MEYEFLRDITGKVKVRMSMGHEALGHWFNEEVGHDASVLDEVEAEAQNLQAVSASGSASGANIRSGWMMKRSLSARIH